MTVETNTLLLVAAVGLFSGLINVLAGGGSLVVMPLLMTLGLNGPMANGTNRIGATAQNLGAMISFWRSNVRPDAQAWRFCALVMPGAGLGAFFGVQLDGAAFRIILVVVMLSVWMWMAVGWWRSTGKKTAPAPRTNSETSEAPTMAGLRASLALMLIGFYGGFLQAGVGFLLIAVLNRGLGIGLVRTNMLKVWIVGAYTLVALPIFFVRGAVDLPLGLALAVGTSVGGFAGARVAVLRGAGFIRIVYSVALLALIVKLIFSLF